MEQATVGHYPNSSWCSFIPNEFLSAIVSDASPDKALTQAAKNTIDQGDDLLARAESSQTLSDWDERLTNRWLDYPEDDMRLLIFDAGGAKLLPGTICQRDTMLFEDGHERVDKIYELVHDIFKFFQLSFGHKVFEKDRSVIAVTFNYGEKYMNAHWTGKRVILGAGDPSGMQYFDEAEDIITHEIAHGIISRTSGLENIDEAGALFEHVADVAGILYKQKNYLDSMDAKNCQWTIGESLWGDRGRMYVIAQKREKAKRAQAPKEAATRRPPIEPYEEIVPCYMRSFDQPSQGNPPQPMHYKRYQSKDYDNGGVHFNCGIPNHAFYTAAIEAGGPPWLGVGQVWFMAMTDTGLGPKCKFARFAAFTLAYAKRYREDLVAAIEKGWKKVGVKPDIIEGIED